MQRRFCFRIFNIKFSSILNFQTLNILYVLVQKFQR